MPLCQLHSLTLQMPICHGRDCTCSGLLYIKKSENVPFFWPILVKNVQVTLIFSCVEGMESYLSLNMFVIVLIYVVGDYVF